MRTREQWHAQISSLAQAGLRGTPLVAILDAPPEERRAFVPTFADDFGHRRAVDPPLVAWVLGVEPPAASPSSRVDVRLWRQLHEPDSRALEVIPASPGPVAPEAKEQGIEVWTEIELASVQALWWHAQRPRADAVRRRALDHAQWLMAELQPDNGTNRPWAAGVFATLASEGDADAAMYAETLLHNCQVALGRPDLLSTVLLLDAERLLAREG